MAKESHLRSFLEGPRWTSLDKFLIHCSELANVNLHIIENEKSFFTQHIDFKVTGNDVQLQKFQDIFDEALDNFRMNSFRSSQFKVDELHIISPEKEFDDKNNIYVATVKTHRFSAITSLAEKIRDEFDLNIHIKEEKELLAKKVTLTIRTKAHKFAAFKNLFLKFVVSKQPFKIVNELGEDIENKHKIKIKM